MSFELKKFIKSCRLCCESLIDKPFLNINGEMIQKFEELTETKLSTSKNFSHVICKLCNLKLKEAANFKKSILSNQANLLQLEKASKEETPVYEDSSHLKKEFKEEPEDYSDLDSDFVHQELVKTELVDEIEDNVDPPSNSSSFKSDLEYLHEEESKTCLKDKNKSKVLKKCEYCLKYFQTHRFEKHVLTHTKCMICDFCGFKAIKKGAFLEHLLRRHSKEERYHCDCGKKFKSSRMLRNHKLEHRPGNYPCNECDKVFQIEMKLKSHKSFYHRPKVPCEVCGIMVLSGNLWKHMRSHDQKNPQSCPTCNSVFDTEFRLNKHIQRQHKAAEIPCLVPGCSHSTKRLAYLRMHYRNHKNIDEEYRNQLLENINNQKSKTH